MLLQIANLLIDSLGSLFIYMLLLRFHMQWLRAPFRNPVGEMVAALTNWMVLPARRFIPGLFGLDLATLILALLAQALMKALLMSLAGFPFAHAPGIAFVILGALSAIDLVRMSINILIAAAIVQALLSFVAPYSPLAPLLNAITEPFYRPFRRFIPPMGNIDLSPLFMIIVAQVLLIPLATLARIVATSSAI
jgi:YggT family protein